jgi:hypothetical protein
MMQVGTDTSNKYVFPELEDLTSNDLLIINQYHGTIKQDYKNQKIVIYTCFGERCADEELVTYLNMFKKSFTIFLTTRDYPKEYENQYNCKIIKIPSAYAWYATQLSKFNLDLNFRSINKVFLSLNNRIQWPRQALFQFINQFDLLDKFYFSYHCEDRFGLDQKYVYDLTNQIIGNTWYNNQVDLEKLYNLIPVTSGIDHFYKNDWTIGNPEYYKKSFASLVTETYIDENNNVFFTEKLMKPLAYGHPFLVHSSAGALKKLKSLGFKTYSSIFDESYDDIESPQQRFEAILRQVLDICNKPISELQNMYESVKPIIQHNYEHFWYELPKIYQKDISEVKEQIKELIIRRG